MESGSELEHKFDWYQASVPTSPEALKHMLSIGLPDEITPIVGKGMHSFLERVDYCDMDTGEIFATIMSGGVNPHPNVKGSGDHARNVARWLRQDYPSHRVSRADIAVDFMAKDAFSSTCQIMADVGEYYGVSGERIIADREEDGSTYYLGSRKSWLRLRCYEKGKQLYKTTGDVLWKDFNDWTRLELQVRPQKAFKEGASKLEPEQFWGLSRWTAQIVKQALQLEVEPVNAKETPIADHERAMRYLVHQYGNTIRKQMQKLGSWEAFCDDLKARLDGESAPPPTDKTAAEIKESLSRD